MNGLQHTMKQMHNEMHVLVSANVRFCFSLIKLQAIDDELLSECLAFWLCRFEMVTKGELLVSKHNQTLGSTWRGEVLDPINVAFEESLANEYYFCAGLVKSEQVNWTLPMLQTMITMPGIMKEISVESMVNAGSKEVTHKVELPLPMGRISF